MERIIKAWEEISEYIKKEVTDVSFRSWFQPLSPVRIDDKKSIIYLTTNNDFASAVVKNRYWNVVSVSVQRVLGPGYRAEIISKEHGQESKKHDLLTEGIMFNGISLNVSRIECNKQGVISKVVLINPEVEE